MSITPTAYRAVFKDYQSQVLDNPSLYSESSPYINELALDILGSPIQQQLKTEDEALSIYSKQCHIAKIDFPNLYRRHTSLSELKQCKRVYEILVKYMNPDVAAPLSMQYITKNCWDLFSHQIFTYESNKMNRATDVENHLTNWNRRLQEGLNDPSCERSIFEKVKVEFEEYLKSSEREDLRTILKTAIQFWPDLFPFPKDAPGIVPLIDDFTLKQASQKYTTICKRLHEVDEQLEIQQISNIIPKRQKYTS